MIDGVEVAQGEDFSKRSAEQISSREALLKLGLIDADIS
jgi:dsRNA-specific ribonuclease